MERMSDPYCDENHRLFVPPGDLAEYNDLPPAEVVWQCAELLPRLVLDHCLRTLPHVFPRKAANVPLEGLNVIARGIYVNAALYGEGLYVLGQTCDRLYEKKCNGWIIARKTEFLGNIRIFHGHVSLVCRGRAALPAVS